LEEKLNDIELPTASLSNTKIPAEGLRLMENGSLNCILAEPPSSLLPFSVWAIPLEAVRRKIQVAQAYRKAFIMMFFVKSLYSKI
jgi:hypothetical protein